MNKSGTFTFKQFQIKQDSCIMKVNTDAILLGAWSDVVRKNHTLDVGTGTGIIALMLAQRNANMQVVGIDVDLNAYMQAQNNMKNSPFNHQLKAYFSSIQEFSIDSNQKFDLIVSNPPFFSGGTFSHNENKANIRHTLKLSHIDLLRSVKSLLSTDGHFDVILPYIEGLRFIELAMQYNFHLEKITEVFPNNDKKIERLLLRLGLQPVNGILKDTLVVQQSTTANDYSEEYCKLTKDFYPFL